MSNTFLSAGHAINSRGRINLVKKSSKKPALSGLAFWHCGGERLFDGEGDKRLGDGGPFGPGILDCGGASAGGVAALPFGSVKVAKVSHGGGTGRKTVDVKDSVSVRPSDLDCHNEKNMT